MKKNIFCFLLCFLSIGSLIAQVPSYVPTSGLVGWWPFNGNALDISGNANNGTVNGATLTTDRFGNTNKAFSFDGIADYIDCGNSSSVNILGDITISAWIYANNFNTDHGIVSKSGLYDFITNSDQSIPPLDKLRWTAGGNAPTIFTNAISGNQWLHLVAVYSSVSGKSVYLNGNLFASNTQTGVTPPNTNYRLYLGAHQPFAVDYWSWNGKLDDIGLWNRALTQQEVTNLYLSTTPVIATASTISDVSCFGGMNGSATVVASQGTPPYTYSWNSNPIQTTQSATNLKSGIYTITVTDSKGSVTTSSTTVTQPSAITNVVASTRTNVSCFGGNNGSVTVSNPLGGTPPYTYLWNTNPVQVTQTATNLIAGNYVITVTDSKGCTATSSATVTHPAQALSNVNATTLQHVKCNGATTGSVSVSNPNGGTPPYTYKWNSVPEQITQTASNLPAGTYSITVTDFNGCMAYSYATINEPTKVTNVQASIVKSLKCFGDNDGSAKVSNPNGGTPPYSYRWNTIPEQNTQTVVNLKAGDYGIIVTDANGCTAQSFITVTQPNAPLVIGNAKIEKQVSCFGESDGSITIPNPSGGTAPYTVSWNTDPIKKTYSISNLKAGKYTAMITDANGCVTSVSATVTEPPKVVVTSPKDSTVLIQTKAFMQAGSNNPASTYQWQTNAGTGFADLQNVFQYSGVKTNTLTVDNCTIGNHNQPFRCIIDTKGCYDTTSVAILSVRTNVGVHTENTDLGVSIYPNPTGDANQIMLQFSEAQKQHIDIELLDILGNQMYMSSINIGDQSTTIPIHNLCSGMYMIRIRMNNEVYMEKVIVN